MANQTVKCRFCKKEINKDKAFYKKVGSYFCNEECYNKQMKKNNKIVNVKKPPSDRRLLTDLILAYYIEQGIDKNTINWTLETARIKNILTENPEWKISGLTYTLQYMHDIEQIDLFGEKSTCILSLVPSYYIIAKNYYIESCEIEEAINDYDLKIEPIHIQVSDIREKQKYEQIPMDDL